MSKLKHKDDHDLPEARLSKDQHKMEASSVDRAHILSILSKCRILQQADDGFSQKIENCLADLDQIEEASLILQALKFSDHVTICLDPKASDLSRMTNSGDLGWYSYQEGELLIGAADLKTDRQCFLGVLAHELAHWCMQTVFKNSCLPYFQTDPNRLKEGEFKRIVHDVAELYSKKIPLDCVITSVFEDYLEDKWHQELIVRVPHLIAQNGAQNATKILSRYPATSALLNFYRNYVMNELQTFIANGVLEKSRETVVTLNEKLGLLHMYRMYEFRFKSRVDIDLQENTSLWVFSSPHPYLSFFKVAWTLNCHETTELFHGNNVFCEINSFTGNFSDITSKFMTLDECKTLFIVFPEIVSETSYNDLFVHLIDIFTIKSHKKVILVVNNKMLSMTKKQLKLKGFSKVNYKCISMKKIEFTDLMKDSQELVLNSAITTHGRNVQLNDLLQEEEYHICDGSLIERLIRRDKLLDKVVVGDENISQRDCPASFVGFYENVKIQKLIDLVNECMESVDEGKPHRFALILVGDIDKYPDTLEEVLCEVLGCDDLNEVSISSADALLERDVEDQSVNPILLFNAEGESEYIRLVLNFKDSCSFEVCYFVKVVSKKVIYSDLMYYPNLMFNRELEVMKASLLKELDGDKCIDQDTFMDNIVFGTERVFVISDTAGAGKSKFLSLIQDSMTPCWVTKCSLKSCIPVIDEHTLAADMDHEEAMAFIMKIGRIDDSFAEDLLNLKMSKESHSPAILLLDGMDEITSSDRNSASKNKEKIVNFIEFLKKFSFLRVVITTRPESQSELSHLSCPVYEFKAISSKDTLTYLTNLCMARNQLFSKSLISLELVMSLVQKYIGGYELDTHVSHDFLTNPLHVSMLSEIIVESMKDGTFNSNIFDTNGTLMPDKLYYEFINNKYRIYFKEKKNIAVDERLKDNCNSAFENLAFFYLHGHGHESINKEYFSNNNLFCYKSGKVSLKYDKVSLYFDIGIISAAPGENVDFVHQTFAEYFVSRLFMSWAQDESMCENWIVDVIYQPHRTLSFFESMLKDTTFPDDITKRHGNIMSNLDLKRTTLTIKYHMWFDRLNILKYIFKCWKYIGKFHVLLDPSTYKNPTHYPLYFASTMASDRILECVLQEGFDINYKTHCNYVISFLFKRCSPALLKGFLENGQLKKEVLANVGNLIVYGAAANGNVALMEWLETLGYDVFHTDSLEHAVRAGKLEMVQWLKNKGVSLHNQSVNSDEETLIHKAVRTRWFHVIKWLIDEGLDINGCDRSGRTPLHDAMVAGHLDMVRFLVENGADLHARTKNGWNALHIAASETLTDIDIFKWLVKQGSRVEEKTTNGSLPIHLALNYKTNRAVIEWLLDQTGDLQATTGVGGWGCAHYAAANNEEFSLSSVISRNCNVHLRDEMGKTAAHVALDTMKALDYDWDDAIENYYNTRMVGPFKLFVLKMAETNESILEELVSYAKDQAKTKFSPIFEMAIEWMEEKKAN